MHKQTILDQIEITRDGTINLRFAKEIVDDDGSVIGSEWHRTAIPPGQDVDAQIAAVNEHLVTHLKCSPVAASELQRVKTLLPMVWTDDVLAAYAVRKATIEAASATGALSGPT